jgi:hypothetical protein
MPLLSHPALLAALGSALILVVATLLLIAKWTKPEPAARCWRCGKLYVAGSQLCTCGSPSEDT